MKTVFIILTLLTLNLRAADTVLGNAGNLHFTQVAPKDFVATFATADKAWTVVWSVTNNNQITLPTTGADNYTVDWGDGVVETGVTTNGQTHVYSSAGLYTNRITGTMTAWSFNGSGPSLTNIVRILSFGDTQLTSLYFAFANCPGLTGSIPSLSANTQLTSLYAAFYNCPGLTGSIPSLSANTQLTSLAFAFAYCTGLTGSIPSLSANTQLTSLAYAFANCTGLTSISPTDMTSSTNITDVSYCFQNCTSLTGASIQFYNAVAFPNISSYSACYSGCTGLSDYSSIPAGWK